VRRSMRLHTSLAARARRPMHVNAPGYLPLVGGTLAAALFEQVRVAEAADGCGAALAATGVIECALARLGGGESGVEQRRGRVWRPVLRGSRWNSAAEQHPKGKRPRLHCAVGSHAGDVFPAQARNAPAPPAASSRAFASRASASRSIGQPIAASWPLPGKIA